MRGGTTFYIALFTALLGVTVRGLEFSHMTTRDVITLYTSTDLDFSQFRLTVNDRDFISFRVRACEEAHILVSEVLGVSPTDVEGPARYDSLVRATQVVLGYNSNTQTIIKEQTGDSTPLASKATPQIIDCNDYRQFWISWSNQTLKVGRGPIYDQQVIVTFDDRNVGLFVNVVSVSFATGTGTTGMWQIDENSGHSSLVLTPGTGLFGKVWRSVEFHSSWFPFSVKANMDAMIGLGAQLGIADYTIVLGVSQNTRTEIRKGDKVLATVHGAILNAQEFRSFWVSWESGKIQLGRGRQKDASTLISYTDGDFQNVGFISFTSSLLAVAKWLVRETSEHEIVMNSPLLPGMTDNSFFLSAPTSQYVAFYIQSCSDTLIEFTQQKGWDDDNTIKVYLGANNNTKIIIGTSYSPDIQEISAVDLLSCSESRQFWASWSLGPLTMGSGEYGNQDILFTFDDPVVPFIHSLAFSNGRPDAISNFTVDYSFGNQFEVNIPSDLPFGGVFLTTKGQNLWRFSIAHAGGAQILLTDARDAIADSYYQVSFGFDQKSVMITRTVNDVQKSKTGTLAVPLEFDVLRPFCISWYQNSIVVSEGHRCGADRTVVDLSWGSPYSVNVITVGSLPTAYGTLQFPMDQDDLLSVQLASKSRNVTRWFRLHETTDWMYLQLANDGVARLSLATWYKDASTEQYILSFNEGGKNQVTLRSTLPGLPFFQSAIGDPWNKMDLRDFWISWEDNQLSVGGGRYRGAQPFFSKIKLPDKLRAIGLRPQKDSNVEWLLPHTFGPEATVFTDPGVEGQNWFKVTHHTAFVFGLRACKNAKVHLTDMYAKEWKPYTVEIGGTDNLYTRIYSFGKQKKGATTKDILSCSEDRYFWISWYDGAISVGKGQQIGEDALVTWHGLAPLQFTAVTMDTSNSTGEWRLGFLGGSLDPKPLAPHRNPGLGGAAIAGIVIGSLVFVALVGCVAYVVMYGVPARVQRILPGPPKSFSSSSSSSSPSGLSPSPPPEDFNNPIQYDDSDYGPDPAPASADS